MKIVISIFLLIVIVLAFVYSRAVFIGRNLSFSFAILGVDFKSIHLLDLLRQGETSLSGRIALIIDNKSNFTLVLKNIQVSLYHNNQLIANTFYKTKQELKEQFAIVPYSVTSLERNARVYINKETINITKMIINKIPVELIYKVKAKSFIFPLSFSGSFVLN